MISTINKITCPKVELSQSQTVWPPNFGVTQIHEYKLIYDKMNPESAELLMLSNSRMLEGVFCLLFCKKTKSEEIRFFMPRFANSNHFQVHSSPKLKTMLYSRIYCYYLTTWSAQPLAASLATSLLMGYKYERGERMIIKDIWKWNLTENRTAIMITKII